MSNTDHLKATALLMLAFVVLCLGLVWLAQPSACTEPEPEPMPPRGRVEYAL